MNLPKIQNHPYLKGRRVLVRCDFNVPIDPESDLVMDDFRIRRTLPTINFLRESGAKVILISHIGRDPQDTLKPVYHFLNKYFNLDFWSSLSEAKEEKDKLKEGNVVLMENLRANSGETGNSTEFAEELASLADIYVNEAFSVSHREHASIVGVPEYLSSFAGILFQKEVSNLLEALDPGDNSLCILGGAKFSTKEPLIEKLASIYKKVFIGGAIANDFFAISGWEVGNSLVSDDPSRVKELLDKENIVIPTDVVVEGEEGRRMTRPQKVKSEEKIMDVGSDSMETLKELVEDSSFILWNGPLGHYEEGYDKQTKNLGRTISVAEAYSIIGGGDTVTVLNDVLIDDGFDFVSTAGGAMLELLLKETLPGIEALKT